MNGDRVNKTLMMIEAMSDGASLEEMLKSAHRFPLSAGDRRDVCVMYGLMNSLDGSEMDAVLEKQGFSPLWPEE